MGEDPVAVRKSYHHTRVLWSGGVISYYAQRCHEFGLNPDVEELERHNREGASRACAHPKLVRREYEDRVTFSCPDCHLEDPEWRNEYRRCTRCYYSITPICSECRGTGLVRGAMSMTISEKSHHRQ
jgi:hypothetical protein